MNRTLTAIRIGLVASMLTATIAFAQSGDRIWTGTIMDDALPRADFVATRNGEIIEVGSGAPSERLPGERTGRVALGGNAMVSGFVDAHGHMCMIGVQALSANMLPAQDGGGELGGRSAARSG